MRFDAGPLLEHAARRYGTTSATQLAPSLGVHRRTIGEWKRKGLPLNTADRAAVRLGVHPSHVWPDWHQR